MSRKHHRSGGLLAGAALGGLALWLIRHHSNPRHESSETARPASDSWLPDDVLDLPSDSSLGSDEALAEIFDRPRR